MQIILSPVLLYLHTLAPEKVSGPRQNATRMMILAIQPLSFPWTSNNGNNSRVLGHMNLD